MHFVMWIVSLIIVLFCLKLMNHEKLVADYSTGEVKELNDNFVQFYIDNMDLIIDINRKNPTAGTILLWIVKHMDKNNALVVSQTAICDALDIHRNTVTNAVNFLKESKALDVFKSGTTNVYAINEQIAWKDVAENKKFAHFSAKVFLSANEQPQFQTKLVGHAVEKKPTRRNRQKALDAVIGLGGSATMMATGILAITQLLSWWQLK